MDNAKSVGVFFLDVENMNTTKLTVIGDHDAVNFVLYRQSNILW
jgi:hypothetical protein